MGNIKKSHMFEAIIWLSIVAIFFGYSFEFNQPIEIYDFGATGWPRVVIFLLLLAAIGNLYYQFKHGSAAQKGRVGAAETDDTPVDYSNVATLVKMTAVLLTPFLFAVFLKPVGIYAGAPVFIALIIYLFGERRWKHILIVTFIIYLIFIGLFVITLNASLPQGNVAPFYDYSATVLKYTNELQKLW